MAVPKIYNEETGKWEPISYPAGADISAEAGNAIVKKSDGLYAPSESETTKKLNNSLTLMVSNGGQMRVTNFDGSEDKTVNLTIPADQDTKYSLDKSGTSLVFTETLTSGAKNINNVDLTDSNIAVGSNTLAEHLDTVPTFSVVGTPTVDAPSVNADLLEGHNAAYFANQSQISALTSDIGYKLNSIPWNITSNSPVRVQIASTTLLCTARGGLYILVNHASLSVVTIAEDIYISIEKISNGEYNVTSTSSNSNNSFFMSPTAIVAR